MARYQPVKDEKGIAREIDSKAIVSINNRELQEYKNLRSIREKEKNEFLQCQDDINMLKDDILEIKRMFGQILNKLESKG